MVIAIDIGNTNIVIGVFKGKKLAKTLRLPTDSKRSKSYYKPTLVKFIKKECTRSKIEGVIISSVVPKTLKAVKEVLSSGCSLKPVVLGENAKVPIKNSYNKPHQVGQDRLINAFAALKIYNKKPLIIVDFGTAVTLDVVSGRGAYLGGVIVPGVELSIENLTRRAALLPKIPFRRPKNVLGKSTVESMLSGIFYGYAALCDGVIEKLKKTLRKRALVIATGGHAKILSSYCSKIDKIDPQLTLKGLNLIYLLIAKNS